MAKKGKQKNWDETNENENSTNSTDEIQTINLHQKRIHRRDNKQCSVNKVHNYYALFMNKQRREKKGKTSRSCWIVDADNLIFDLFSSLACWIKSSGMLKKSVSVWLCCMCRRTFVDIRYDSWEILPFDWTNSSYEA